MNFFYPHFVWMYSFYTNLPVLAFPSAVISPNVLLPVRDFHENITRWIYLAGKILKWPGWWDWLILWKWKIRWYRLTIVFWWSQCSIIFVSKAVSGADTLYFPCQIMVWIKGSLAIASFTFLTMTIPQPPCPPGAVDDISVVTNLFLSTTFSSLCSSVRLEFCNIFYTHFQST